MRGFEDTTAKSEATLDNVLEAITKLETTVTKLVNVLAPDTPDDKQDDDKVTE